jgi:hypothetical protein
MTQEDKIQFVLDLTARIAKDVVGKIRDNKIPESWDDVLLKELLKDNFKLACGGKLAPTVRIRYVADLITNNL